MNSAFWLSLTSILFLHTESLATSDQLVKPFTLDEPFQIKHLADRKIQKSDLGHVFGARDCAISGRVYEIRAEKCRTEVPAICSLLPDKASKLEIVFMPTENIDKFKFRTAAITSEGLSKSFETPATEQKLQAGEPYLLTYSATPTAELSGEFSIGRIEIVDSKDGQAKMCVEAEYFIWPKNVPVNERKGKERKRRSMQKGWGWGL